MAIINISSVLEYSRPSGILHKVGEWTASRCSHARYGEDGCGGVSGSTPLGGVDEERMNVDEEHQGDVAMKPHTSEDVLPEQPPTFKFALRLTFAILSCAAMTRKSSRYARSNINPYLIVLLTFFATILKHRPALDVLERSILWGELATLFATVRRKIMISQGFMREPGKSNGHRNVERWVMLTSGCPPPLVKDWFLCGMEWIGRKV